MVNHNDCFHSAVIGRFKFFIHSSIPISKLYNTYPFHTLARWNELVTDLRRLDCISDVKPTT